LKNKIKYYHYLIVSFLFFGVSLLIWYVSVYTQPSKGYEIYTSFISEKINKEISISKNELDFVAKGLSNRKDEFSWLLQLKLKYPVYIFKNGNLVYWSEYKFIPKYSLLEGKDKLKYVRLPIGKFIVNKKDIGSDWEIFSFIPLSHEYSIDNNYISSGLNEEIFTHENIDFYFFHTS
jgi:two-component system nitrogen regulation sensor histidine kinase NtrY